MVIIFYALEREITPFKRTLPASSRFETGGLAGWRARLFATELVMVATGVGLRRSTESVKRALETFPDPTLVISTGVCGALRAELRPGTIVVADRLIMASSDAERFEEVPVASGQIALIRRALATCRLPIVIGPTLSVRHVLPDGASKQHAHRESGAIAVDMESAAIARECQKENVPFAYVRAVLDARDDLLLGPGIIDKTGHIRILKAVASLLLNPPALLTLWRLVKNMSLATANLSQALTAITAQHADHSRTNQGS